MTSVHDQYPNTAWVAICRDGPAGAAVRAAHTAAHLAYIETILEQINVAGPLFDEAGLNTVGSLFCYRTKSHAQARALVEGDPYFKGGAFASVELFPHLPAAGQYIGGKVW